MIDFIKELSGWQIFMYAFAGVMMVFNVVFTFVVTIGGVYDLIYFFRELRKEPDELHKEGNSL